MLQCGIIVVFFGLLIGQVSPKSEPSAPPTKAKTKETHPAGASEKEGTNVDWLLPIDLQLRYLRNHDIQHAYEETTSSDFKKVTSLENYTKYIENHPILFNHIDIAIKNQSIGKDEANVIVNLNPEKEDIAVNYLLRIENGKWKIWSMNVSSPYSATVEALLNNPQLMRKVVEEHLQALKANDIQKAYYEYTSQEFQKTTSLDDARKFVASNPGFTQYDALQFKQPLVNKATGHIEVSIHSKFGTLDIGYTLGIENDKWKIWQMQIIKSTPELVLPGTEMPEMMPVETGPAIPPSMTLERPSMVTPQPGMPSEATPSLPGLTGSPKGSTGMEKPALQFARIEVGTSLNARGEIENPSIVLKAPKGSLYVNVYVRNGIANTKILITLEHLDTHSALPEASTTLQQNGDSILSFAFASPTQGWPLGNYLIDVTSATGLRRQSTFIIRQ